MSTQQALLFIASVRGMSAEEQQAVFGDNADGLEPLLKLAERLGFELTEQELLAAHRTDWQMRLAGALNQIAEES